MVDPGGLLVHGGRPHFWAAKTTMKTRMNGLRDGDVLGLLLDLDQQSLAVYLNSRRLGLLVSRESPEEVAPVVTTKQPVQWMVALSGQTSIKMVAGPPPLVLADEAAAEMQRTQAFWAERSRKRDRAPSPQPWQKQIKEAEDDVIKKQLHSAFGIDPNKLLEKCVPIAQSNSFGFDYQILLTLLELHRFDINNDGIIDEEEQQAVVDTLGPEYQASVAALAAAAGDQNDTINAHELGKLLAGDTDSADSDTDSVESDTELG